jgi:hypothetical protein
MRPAALNRQAPRPVAVYGSAAAARVIDSGCSSSLRWHPRRQRGHRVILARSKELPRPRKSEAGGLAVRRRALIADRGLVRRPHPYNRTQRGTAKPRALDAARVGEVGRLIGRQIPSPGDKTSGSGFRRLLPAYQAGRGANRQQGRNPRRARRRSAPSQWAMPTESTPSTAEFSKCGPLWLCLFLPAEVAISCAEGRMKSPHKAPSASRMACPRAILGDVAFGRSSGCGEDCYLFTRSVGRWQHGQSPVNNRAGGSPEG